jgi:hypothetical protein
MTPKYLGTVEIIENYSGIRKLLPFADIFTFHRRIGPSGKLLSAMFDDYLADTRICIDVDEYPRSVYVKVNLLHGYNKEKHCWEQSGRTFQIELQNRKGRKQLLEDLKNHAIRQTGYPNPSICTVYRRISAAV